MNLHVWVIFVLLILVPAVSSDWFDCTLDSWCWDGSANAEYIVLNQSATASSGEALCAAQNSSLVLYSKDAVDVLRSVGVTAKETWTDLRLSSNRTGSGIEAKSTGTAQNIAWHLISGGVMEDGECFWLSQKTGMLVNKDCNATASLTMCQRTGRPDSWTRTSLSELEYGVFTLKSSYEDAKKECAKYGAAVGYVPCGISQYQEFRQRVMVDTLAMDEATSYWAGYTHDGKGTNEPGDWDIMSIVAPAARPDKGGTTAGCYLLKNLTLESTPSLCTTLAPFICSRLKRPENEDYTFDDGTHYYRFSPKRDINNLTATHRGVGPMENIEDCAQDGGEAFKYHTFSEVQNIYGNATSHLTTIYKEIRDDCCTWLDNSSSPFPANFDKKNKENRCYYYHNIDGSVLQNPEPFYGGTCTHRLSGLCQFNLTNSVNFTIDTTAVETSAECGARWTAKVSRPPFGNQVFRFCAAGILPTSSVSIPCFEFKDGSMSSQVIVQNPKEEEITITMYPVCTPNTDLCALEHNNVSVTVKSTRNNPLSVNNTEQDTYQAAFVHGSFGTPIQAPSMSYPSYLHPTRLALSLSGDDDLDCHITPKNINVAKGGALPTVTVMCEEASSTATNITLSVTSSPVLDGKCSQQNLTSFDLMTMQLTAKRTISFENRSTFAYGSPIKFPFEISDAPSNYSRPRWLCLSAVAYEHSNIRASMPCFYSDKPSVVSLTSAITFTDYTALRSSWIRYKVIGNGAAAYNASEIVAQWTLNTFNISVSGLNEEEYVDVPVIIKLEIPTSGPTGYNVSAVVSFTPDAGQQQCGLEPANVTYASTSELSQELTWYPTCRTNATMIITLVGDLAYLFNVNVDRTNIVVNSPKNLIVSAIPQRFFLNAPSYAILVSLPSPIKIFNSTLCPVVEGFVTDAPLEILPRCQSWNASDEEAKQFELRGISFAYQATLNWTLFGSARMYKPPATRLFSVWNQSEIKLEMSPSQAYFVNMWYMLEATFTMMPPAGESLTIEAADGVEDVEVQPQTISSTTSRVVSIPVRFLAIDTGNTASIALNFTGVARDGYWVHNRTMVVQRVAPQARITVNAPKFLLTGVGSDGQTRKDIILSISEAPRGSARVTVSLTCSDALKLDPSSVTWGIGEKQDQKVSVTSQSESANASVAYSVVSLNQAGVATGEADPQIYPQNSTLIPVRTKTVITADFPEGSSVTLIMGRNSSGMVNITALPSQGEVAIGIQGPATNYIKIVPENMTFTPDSSSTTMDFTVVPIQAVSSEVKFTYVFTGTAQGQYTLEKKRSEGMTVIVNQQIKMTVSMPPALITDSLQSYTATIKLQELPRDTNTLTASLFCDGCSDALKIVPDNLTWSGAATTQQLSYDVQLTPLKPTASAILRGVITGGSASGFIGFTKQFAIRDPSPVVVSFPTVRHYAGESAYVVVDITNPVLAKGQQLHVTATPNSSAVTLKSRTLTFDSNRLNAKERFQIESTDSLSNFTVLHLAISIGGSALKEYNKTTTVLAGVVAFRPKRWVRVTQFPDIFYQFQPTPITVAIEENPDPGTTIIISANEGTIGAVWEGTNDNTFTEPDTKEIMVSMVTLVDPTLQLALKSFSSQQRGRYRVAGAYDVVVEPKIFVSFGNSLNSKQVIGANNNQSLIVTINRLPLTPLTLTPKFRSPFARTLTFSPPTLVWAARNDTNGSTNTLSQNIYITGELIGSAKDIQFDIEGHDPELAFTTTSVALKALTIVPQYTIEFKGAFERLYLGDANNKTITITLSDPPTMDLVINCTFTDDGAVSFNPQTVVFSAESGLTSTTVEVIGERAGSAGAILLDVLEGPEYNTVVSGSVAFLTYDKIRSWVALNGVEVERNTTVTIESDRVYHAEFYVNEFAEAGTTSTFSLDFDHKHNTSKDDQNLIVQNTTFNFEITQNEGKLFLPMQFVASTLTSFTENITVVAPQSDYYFPGYSFTLHVLPSATLNVTDFPTLIVTGAVNKKTFFVKPSSTPSFGSIAQADIDATQCGGVTVTPERQLMWSTADAKNDIGVVVETDEVTDSCFLQFTQSVTAVPSFAKHIYFSGRFEVFPSPVIQMSNITANDDSYAPQPDVPLQLPFRDIRDSSVVLRISVLNGELIDFSNVTLNFTMQQGTPAAKAAAAASEYHMVMFVTYSESDEPRGLLANKDDPDMVSIATGPDFIEIKMGPMPSLILIEPESIEFSVFRGAFVNDSIPVGANNTITFGITQYVASIVQIADFAAAGGLAFLAMLGLSAAPAALMQGPKVSTMLLSLDCPTERFGRTDDMAASLIAAGVGIGIVLLLTGIHILIITAFYIQRRADSSRRFADLCGRFYFPAVEYIVIFVTVTATSTAAFRTLMYSENVSFRIGAFVALLPIVVGIPFLIHGVVWRNMSIEFESVFITNALRKQFCMTRLMRKLGKWHHPEPHYVRRYWILFSEQRDNFRWYMLFEYFGAVAIGMAGGVIPSTRGGCVAKCTTITVTIFFQCGAVLLWRPFRVQYWSVVFGIIYFVQTLAMILVTWQIGQEIRDDNVQRASVALTIFSMVILVLSVIWNGVYRVLFRAHDRMMLSLNKHEKTSGGGSSGKEASDSRGYEAPSVLVLPREYRKDRPHDSDDEDEDDPETRAALAHLEEAQKRLLEPTPQGVFRNARRVEGAYSPTKRKQLQEEDAARQRLLEDRLLGSSSPNDGQDVEMSMVRVQSSESPKRSVKGVDDLPWLEDATVTSRRKQLQAEEEAANAMPKRVREVPFVAEL